LDGHGSGFLVECGTVLRIRDVLSGSRIRPFSHPVSGSKHYFKPDPGSYMKSGMQTYFFLASSDFRSKVLVLVIVKQSRDPKSGKKFIPDPGGKKHRIPGIRINGYDSSF
jgi:hypothetical protein